MLEAARAFIERTTDHRSGFVFLHRRQGFGKRFHIERLADVWNLGRAMPVERVVHDDPNAALDRVRAGTVKGRLVLDAGRTVS